MNERLSALLKLHQRLRLLAGSLIYFHCLSICRSSTEQDLGFFFNRLKDDGPVACKPLSCFKKCQYFFKYYIRGETGASCHKGCFHQEKIAQMLVFFNMGILFIYVLLGQVVVQELEKVDTFCICQFHHFCRPKQCYHVILLLFCFFPSCFEFITVLLFKCSL